MARIIVVTPDVAFMHSLTFILESGGVGVLSYDTLDSAFGSAQVRHVSCAVVDDDAIHDWQYAEELFRSFYYPVILLMGQYCPPLDVPFARCLAKPFLGEPLIEAVQHAMTGKF